ncbi:hypothetical protein TRICI_006278 [Trichomonascus ciferrii]|uniref:Something about silencing protein 4 domain-containing protein n=1 Tax=Trichomonascus ciferrii TaxID=44093 RepID=A0A642UL00_9ASCO|nr:hypothetical protein TRICI_006278 [Trichomonascus ciferrii]
MTGQEASETPPEAKTRRKSLRSNELDVASDESGSKLTTPPAENNNVWFYFDLSRRVTDYNAALPILREKGSAKYKPPLPSGSTKAVKIQAEKVALENNVVAPSEDPLADEVYGAYFRRKEREEKRIQTIERDKNFMEIDRLETFKEQLDGPNWKKDLRKITHIDDPSDNHELEEKRKLTLAEIKIYIDRYKEWKAREVALKSTKYDYHPYIDPPKSPSPVPSSPAKQSPKQKHYPKTSTVVPPKPKKFTSFYENPTLRPKFDQLTRPSHHQLRSPHLAFGQPIPDLVDELHPFDIPQDWKTSQPKRIKLVTR